MPEFVLIAGGGKVGMHLIRDLLKQGHEISLVEKDKRVCSQVAEEFDRVTVVRGDATDTTVLEMAGIKDANVVVAAAGRDQDNYVICKVARNRYGVNRTVARVNDPRNENLFRIAGVEHVISVTSMVSHAIEHDTVSHDLMTLYTWHERLSIVEVRPKPTSPVVGKAVRDLSLPTGSVLVGIWRAGEPIIPEGSTVLAEGDEIFAVTLRDQEDLLRAALVG